MAAYKKVHYYDTGLHRLMQIDNFETDVGLEITFYGGDYFRFEKWEVKWKHGGEETHWGVKLWKVKFFFLLI